MSANPRNKLQDPNQPKIKLPKRKRSVPTLPKNQAFKMLEIRDETKETKGHAVGTVGKITTYTMNAGMVDP